MNSRKIVYIKEKSFRAQLAKMKLGKGGVALVMRKTIYLYGVTRAQFLDDDKWVCHELQHVKQYEQEGTIKFLLKYFVYWLQYGYYNIPYEKDARANENNNALLKEYLIH